ncbi:MAG: Mth938-like domain-containing protein [Bacillota bacterium]
MITGYSFGRVEFDNQDYTSDLLIYGSEVKDNWWRKDGHSLCYDDLEWLLAREVEKIIIGTGKSGRLEVPTQLKENLSQRGIELISQPTAKAVETFNQAIAKQDKVGAGLHLTC